MGDGLVCNATGILETNGATVVGVEASGRQRLCWEVVVSLGVRGIRLRAVVIRWRISDLLTNQRFQG